MKTLIEFRSTKQLIATIEDIHYEMVAGLQQTIRRPYSASQKPDWLTPVEAVAGAPIVPFQQRAYSIWMQVYVKELSRRSAAGDIAATTYLADVIPTAKTINYTNNIVCIACRQLYGLGKVCQSCGDYNYLPREE